MDSVTIDRLQFALVASSAPDRADALLARLRDVAEGALAPAIAARLAGAGGDRYLFIERLVFDCPLNAAWSDDRLADALAKTLIDALAANEAQPAHGIAFRDRAEYLAAFLIALADGSAWRQWCFDEFDGLKLLPASGALRTVLAAEGAAGLAALARLTGDATRRVLQSLTGADAGRLLEHLLAGQPPQTAPLAMLLRLIDDPLAAALEGASPRRLAWLTALNRVAPSHAHAGALNALAWLDTLRQACRAGRLDAALDADLAPPLLLAACCHAAGLDGARPAAWSDADCAELAAWLRALAPPRSAATPASAEPERVYCRHGGAWLLLVQLARLGWWTRWRASLDSSGPDNADALAARLALAVVARALGGPACAAIEADGVLRRALAVAGAHDAKWMLGRKRLLAAALALPAPEPLRSGPTSLERALQLNALALLREFASRLPGCSESSAAYLRSECLAVDAGVAIGKGRIEVRLGRAPLDVLLTLAGLKRSSAALPDGRTLALQPECAP